MPESTDSFQRYVHAIRHSDKTIYDVGSVDDGLWMPSSALQNALGASLTEISLAGLPLRTRSKVVKEHICRALGYPVPPSFRKTQPRFPAQNFDVYVQKSTNLQIWNEDLDATRRYVILEVGEDDKIKQVKVVSGEELARLERTGTLTQKYQARLIPTKLTTELVTEDTDRMAPIVTSYADLSTANPTANPQVGELLSIRSVFDRLSSLVGTVLTDPGPDQERRRGALLHALVSARLGYPTYDDNGRFPDIGHQLLEVKLQTSPTIDLGLVDPHSDAGLDVYPSLDDVEVRHCDVRYAIFCGALNSEGITLSRLFVTTGEMFFARFVPFQGRKVNRKIQIPLPRDFFDTG